MDAGSSCFCLLCHPSAKACQFHYHASVTRMRRHPGMPKAERLCIYVRACPCITKYSETPPARQTNGARSGFALTPGCRFTGTRAAPRSPLHALTQTFVFTEPLLMMGGSMMFVCVPKELALPLGPNQQPTAAGYEQNCFFVCFFLFSCFFFFS